MKTSDAPTQVAALVQALQKFLAEHDTYPGDLPCSCELCAEARKALCQCDYCAAPCHRKGPGVVACADYKPK